ncbi:zinc finger protein ZAT9-like [Salvia divinorum]|uniref:Zinc finger protein ZAT9-like n=1 Tax=Salvia divinorum TaxID=28513 RepID=A0ABD1HAF5_SALDI
MEKEHICKFCSKSFPCGRSLGGHMRSHLVNTPPLGHPERRPPKKKLPPLTVDQSCHENLKACKECGKTFPSWKALFGHMKCHSPTNGGILVMDSQSDNEVGTTPPCKRKRSDRTITTRYNNTSITNSSSSLTIATTTEINDDDDDDDQHDEQEEVALSLIILSRDKSYWGAVEDKNSKLDPKSTGVESLQKLKPPRVETKTRKLKSLNNETEVGFDEFEVNSPKKLIKRKHHDQFGRERKVSREGNSCSKFRCSICKKDFQSYQALGGHRASHKKFKGCCAPRSSLETEDSHSPKSKEHECPICFKVFPSGQALGGHKRSHLITDQAKASLPHQTADRAFLDLNLPAPTEEEECGEFGPWWIGGAARLSLLSTS